MNIQRALALILAAVGFTAVLPQASAIVYDLNATQTVVIENVYGKAIYTTAFNKTTGTGVIDPFLSIQAQGNSPSEQGYNSDAGNFDTKRLGQYTRDQRILDLQTVVYNGIEYYSFLIDINESNSAATSTISLDSIKIYTRPSALGSPTTNLADLGTLRYDLDVGGVDIDFIYDDLNSGSGQGDIAFFIPTSNFIGTNPTDFFYLYQQFGTTVVPGLDLTVEGGFEETRHAGDIMPIPETDAILPLLAVLGVVVACPFIRRCIQP